VFVKPQTLAAKLDEPIVSSGMTTTGVMAAFRTLIRHAGLNEKNIPLMMTGGPDGDLGANQIQCYQGPICLIIDSGGVLFDPQGLDRGALLKLCVARHTSPRLNSADFPVDALSPKGFAVRHRDADVRLPNGTVVEDGAYFHRTFLTAPDMRPIIEEAHIGAFIPCGGFKDTVNLQNVDDFLSLFTDLHTIIEGANVFFDDAARDHIAATGRILQIKDSTANKGGVMSSSLAEVLAAFLLGDRYETELVENPPNRFRLARELMAAIRNAVSAETAMLLNLYEQNGRTVPLWRLSIRTSEWLLQFQDALRPALPAVLADAALAQTILADYVPDVLSDIVGSENLLHTLSQDNLLQYRDAILTKKLAAMALYRYATCWQAFLNHFETRPDATIRALANGTDIPALPRGG
jgi:glutamate dehydrogenase